MAKWSTKGVVHSCDNGSVIKNVSRRVIVPFYNVRFVVRLEIQTKKAYISQRPRSSLQYIRGEKNLIPTLDRQRSNPS